jgi:tripartite-type tricarboxylate transporter receptor subunit TctC
VSLPCKSSFWRGALTSILLACAAISAAHAAYPDKPIRWLVGYPAGGGSDFLARTLGHQLADQLKQPVIIDNRPGAAGMIGADAAAKSSPDGYTLFTADNGILIYNPVMYKKIPYNPEKDFAPIGLIARVPLVLVASAGTKLPNLASAIAAMKANPGKFSFASPGNGSPHHLAMELFKEQAGVFAVHIPYRGAAPAMQDVIGGQVPLMVVDTSTALTHIKSGTLVPLAVFSAKRIPTLPNVPTLRENGYKEAEAYAWQGLVVPAATPPAMREKLTKELEVAMQNPTVRRTLLEGGWEPNPTDATLMNVYMMAERAKWHKLIRDRGIRAD